MKLTPSLLAGITAAATFLGYSPLARANTIYHIEPSLSQIVITGDAYGFYYFSPQNPPSPDSNVVDFGGDVDISIGGGDITFNGATADAFEQPYPISPLPFGVTGSAPADAGLYLGGPIAVRDVVLGVTGGPTALVGGTDFDLTDLTLTITSGFLDFNSLLIGSGRKGLTGIAASPTSGMGTLTGNYLIIPVDVYLPPLEISSGTFAHIHLAGQIVATIPEPSSLWLGCLAGAWLSAYAWRTRKRQFSRAWGPNVSTR